MTEDDKQQLRQLLDKLILTPSVSGDYQANHLLIEFIADFLSQRGLLITRKKYNGFESLVATTQKTKNPKVLLVAHIDVVPAASELFKLQEKNGKFYGRGVFDMKFAVPLFLHLVDKLQGRLADYDFGIMITTDEEIGGYNGVKCLLQDGYSTQVAIIPDGGGNWQIEEFAKGIFWAKIETFGKTAHASRPWEGTNATNKLLDLLQAIRQLFDDSSQQNSTLNIGQLQSGQATNQISDYGVAKLDIRTASLQDHLQLRQKIESLCQKAGAKFTATLYEQPCINDPNNPWIAQFIEIMQTATGLDNGTTRSFGASDARFFSEFNIPCIIVSPPGGNSHSPHEWLSVQGFYDMYQILEKYLKKVAKSNN